MAKRSIKICKGHFKKNTVEPPLGCQPLFGGQRPTVQEKCQLYTVIKTTIQRPPPLPRPVSCRPKGKFVLFYTSINYKLPKRFEYGRFGRDEGKRMTMSNTVKTHFQQYLIRLSQSTARSVLVCLFSTRVGFGSGAAQREKLGASPPTTFLEK